MKDLLKNLYDITEKESGTRSLKVAITKSGLKRELAVPYRVNENEDVRVYIVKGSVTNLDAFEKTLPSESSAICEVVYPKLTKTHLVE